MNHADLIIYLECDLEKEKELYNSLQDDINFLLKQASIHKEGFYAREKLPYHLLEKQEEFGIDVDCYVLDDQQKAAVISQSGMGRVLGLSEGGMAFPRFLSTKIISEIVGDEITHKISQPIKFQWGKSGGEEQKPANIHGFDVTLLIDICRALVNADLQGKLSKARYARILGQAHIILNASAKSGIKGVVYALAGYNPTTEEVIAAFKLYVQEEAKKYENNNQKETNDRPST